MDDKLLVSLVEPHECLYNRCCKSYKNTDEKAYIWRLISIKMKTSEDFVTKRWHYLVNIYCLEKQQENYASSNGFNIKSQWPLMQTMENFYTRIEEKACNNSNESSFSLSPSPSPLSSPTPVLRKRKRQSNEDNSFKEAIAAFIKVCKESTMSEREKENEPIHGFGQMLVATIRSMTPVQQVKAMQRVTALVMEMKLEPEDE